MAPIVLLLVSGALLGFGIYHHYTIFQDEYRFSTWQDQLKIYGPGVVIGATVIFLIGFILSFFGGPSVPIPPMPEMPEMPAVLTEATPVQAVFNTLNNITNNVRNTFMPEEAATAPATAPAPVPVTTNNINVNKRNSAVNATQPLPPVQPQNMNKNRKNIRQSFFEEI